MSKQTGKCKLTLNRERERAKSGLEAKKDFPEKKVMQEVDLMAPKLLIEQRRCLNFLSLEYTLTV